MILLKKIWTKIKPFVIPFVTGVVAVFLLKGTKKTATSEAIDKIVEKTKEGHEEIVEISEDFKDDISEEKVDVDTISEKIDTKKDGLINNITDKNDDETDTSDWTTV